MYVLTQKVYIHEQINFLCYWLMSTIIFGIGAISNCNHTNAFIYISHAYARLFTLYTLVGVATPYILSGIRDHHGI